MDALRKLTLLSALAIACGSDEAASEGSPCKAFPKGPEHAIVATPLVPIAARRAFALSEDTLVTFAGHELKDVSGRVVLDVAPIAEASILDVTMSPDGRRAFVLYQGMTGTMPSRLEYRLVRYVAENGVFGPAKDMIEVPIGPGSDAVLHAGALAAHKDGTLFVALGDTAPSLAQDPSSLVGKVLRLDVSGDRAIPVPEVPAIIPRREVWSLGIREPRGLFIDYGTGDIWLADKRGTSDELHRVLPRRNYGWPARTVAGDFAVPVATLEGPRRLAEAGAVARGEDFGAISGAYVYSASKGLVAVHPHGPSGTAEFIDLPNTPSGRVESGVIGTLGPSRSVLLVLGSTVQSVSGDRPSLVPTSLAQTGCWDFAAANGAPKGAIVYDVGAPLWSDGADKSRFVVAPSTARARANGDLIFPEGTVAVKTFSFGGRKIETRLFVQHAKDDWVGYSYAWNDQGTDATLVSGSRVVDLPGPAGAKWYFPSRSDCNACHTAAAGFTLGLETAQTGAAPFANVVEGPPAPEPPRLDSKDARAYLHANCSICHRGGSVTGLADLDLAWDTPLAETGLCADPKVSALGIANAKIVAPGDPERSVLVRRMKALDDTRMPKLATRVVDAAGVATVEAWVRSLPSCP